MSLNVNISKEGFLALARVGKIVPIYVEVFGGNDTPIGIYEKVSRNRSGTFLLESAEQGVWSRYSFIGVSSRNSLIKKGPDLKISHPELAMPEGGISNGKPLDIIREIQSAWQSVAAANLPPLTSGLVGLFGWDIIREIESLPESKQAAYQSPTIQLQMVKDIIAMDHSNSSILLISNVYCDAANDFADEYDKAVAILSELFAEIAKPGTSSLSLHSSPSVDSVSSNSTEEYFLDMVAKAKDYVRIGDIFQVVISQRFDTNVTAKPIDIYRVLRSLNPSPYMYLLNFDDGDGPYSVVGSSPEALVKVNSSKVVMHPIAGSRPRGADEAADTALADSLLADDKEKAEHLMLVDLARNDLLKVCKAQTVSVTEFMTIHKFSHVMHLVSTVEGELEPNRMPIDVFRATFPAGTLSGAPKPRALEIIEELETDNRGIFGGVVGYLDFAGNADLAIAIRTAFIRDGKAHVQAGAGIVLDSVPESEYQETIAKASAVLRAIKQANSNFGS